jgi:hypothetical protein
MIEAAAGELECARIGGRRQVYFYYAPKILAHATGGWREGRRRRKDAIRSNVKLHRSPDEFAVEAWVERGD